MVLKKYIWIFLAILLFLAAIWTIVLTDTPGSRLLEFLRIIISWPFMIGVVVIVFLLLFRDTISEFIKRLSRITLPGGATIQTAQPPTPEETGEGTKWQEFMETLESHLADKEEELDKTRHDVETALRNAKNYEELLSKAMKLLEDSDKPLAEKDKAIRVWMFSYLTMFFVPATKTVLQWVAGAGKVSKALYEMTFAVTITDDQNRNRTWAVLETYGMVHKTESGLFGDLYEISPTGRDFLAFIGQSPGV